MKSSRKRSAASAFGYSEELPAAADGIAGSENNSSVAENTDNDAQPTTKLISKIQAVELLTTLIQFVPNEYSEGSAVAEKNCAEAADNAEIADIKILSQFKLRYLCRRFRNIIHSGKPLTVNLLCHGYPDAGRTRIRITDGSGIHLSRETADDGQFSSLEILPQHVDSFLVNLRYSDSTAGRSYPSVPSLLCRYTQAIKQPTRLALNLCAYSASAVTYFVRDFGIPFAYLFPNVTLDTLSLYAESSMTDLANERDCLKYFLAFSPNALVELSVSFPALSSAVTTNEGNAQPNLSEGRVASLPTDWTCSSLRTLNLCGMVDTSEEGDIDIEYDYNDANLRAAAHAEFAKLRRWFPNITKMKFTADRPQIDFAVLNEFAVLRKFTLGAWVATTDELRADSHLVPLTRMESFCFHNNSDFPLYFSIFLPNVKKLKIDPLYPAALADLANEIETIANPFQLLQSFVIKMPYANVKPSFRDLVRLIRSLGRLPNLVSLKVRCASDYDDSGLLCPSGDLSLLQVLPKTLTNVSFCFALLPNGATRDYFHNPPWTLNSLPEVPMTGESIYKDWLRSLLFRIAEHPALEHFYCLCVAPQFEAIIALAEKWNRSSVKAIAELGLAFVVHVQCTPAYTRMLETRIPKRDDCYKFRFVLSPSAELAGASGSSTKKRKFVTVEFHNPN